MRRSVGAIGIALLAAACVHAGQGGSGGVCSAAYPQGMHGRLRTWVLVTPFAPPGMQFDFPDSLRESLRDVFMQTVDADAAANPGGPQFTWVGYGDATDLVDQVGLHASGSGDEADSAWTENTVQAPNQGGLFEERGRAVTRYEAGGNAATTAAMIDAAHRFYRAISTGWRCP